MTSLMSGRQSHLSRRKPRLRRQKMRNFLSLLGMYNIPFIRISMEAVLTRTQTYWPEIQALEWSDCYKPRIVQLLQLQWQRNFEGESYSNITNIWCRTMRTSSILRHARCPYEDRSRHCILSRHRRMYSLCPRFQYNQFRYPSVFKKGRYHRSRQSGQLRHQKGFTNLSQYSKMVRTQRYGGPGKGASKGH